MKNLLLTLMFLACTPLFVFAQDSSAHFWVESENRVTSDDTTPKLKGLFSRDLDERFGVFGYFEANRFYGEAYVGATFKPATWVEVAYGAGLEQSGRPLRTGGYLWVGRGRYSLLLLEEYGGSGTWRRLETTVAFGRIGLGVMAQTGLGLGPRAEMRIPKVPIVLRGAALFDRTTGQHTELLGARMKF